MIETLEVGKSYRIKDERVAHFLTEYVPWFANQWINPDNERIIFKVLSIHDDGEIILDKKLTNAMGGNYFLISGDITFFHYLEEVEIIKDYFDIQEE